MCFPAIYQPENSTRGRDAQSFFAHLLTQIYINSESEAMFIGADFNARIGCLSDIIHECYSIPERTVIDTTLNQHGRDFTDFLNDAKFCILNGRFSNDNFTSISRKGKAVVDYLCVPHDTFTSCKDFKVVRVQEIVDQHGLHGLLGERSRLPDHSVLLSEFDFGYCQTD